MDIHQFINEFPLEKHGLSSPVKFSDALGFSTSKERKQNGLIFVSLYRFYFEKNVLDGKENKKPIMISVSYAEKLEDGTLRLSPTSIPRKINWPIELLSENEFFYDFNTRQFYFKNKKINVDDIIRKVEFLHTKPTKLLRGSILIIKILFWRTLVTNIFKLLYYSLIKTLYVISGTKTKQSIWLVNIDRSRSHEDPEVTKESFAKEKINIFGYHASAWSVVAYASLHLSTYSLWYFCLNVKNDFIKNIFSNGFLTIVYVIPSLVFFEKLIPRLIEYLIKKSGIYFHRTSFKKIRI